MSTTDQWARLLDPGHVTAALVDLAAFQVALGLVCDHLAGPLQRFMADAQQVGEDLGDRDRRLAAADPNDPAAAMPDAIDWLAEMGCLDSAQADRLGELLALRADLALAPHRALTDDRATELLGAVIDLRELLAHISGWWWVNVESGRPGDQVVSMGDAVLGHIIAVAQKAARP